MEPLFHALWEAIVIGVGDLLGGSLVAILIALLILVGWTAYRWHLSRIAEGERGIEAPHLVVGSLVLLVIMAVSVIAGVILWRASPAGSSNTPTPSNATSVGTESIAGDQGTVLGAGAGPRSARNQPPPSITPSTDPTEALNLKQQLDTANQIIVDLKNRSVSPNVDLLNGAQHDLFIGLLSVFEEIKAKQDALIKSAGALFAEQHGSEANGTQPRSMPLYYFVPPCRIIVSSNKENENLAKFIEIIAISQNCEAIGAPAPPPLPRTVDADAPPPQPFVIPPPLPYIVVRYPKPEDVQALPIGNNLPYQNRMRSIDSDEINQKAANLRDQIANSFLGAFQRCGMDARRSRKVEGVPGWDFEKWTIYIDLGSTQICH